MGIDKKGEVDVDDKTGVIGGFQEMRSVEIAIGCRRGLIKEAARGEEGKGGMIRSTDDSLRLLQ